jgi:hypothetical protein
MMIMDLSAFLRKYKSTTTALAWLELNDTGGRNNFSIMIDTHKIIHVAERDFINIVCECVCTLHHAEILSLKSCNLLSFSFNR